MAAAGALGLSLNVSRMVEKRFTFTKQAGAFDLVLKGGDWENFWHVEESRCVVH